MNYSCPVCNHAFEAEPTARPACPRCGESFAVKGHSPSVQPIMARDIGPTVDLGRIVRRRLIQSFVVSFLIIIVLIAIAAWKLRPEKPLDPPIALPALNGAVTQPEQLSGLKLLPAKCSVVFAVQPGPFLDYAEKTKRDPVKLLTDNRIPASALGTLAKAGITLQHIDHIVGGLYIPEKDEDLRIAFVLVLRQALDNEETFLDGLKAKKGPTGYDVQFDKFTVRMKRASATEWVFGLNEQDLVPAGSLSPEMRALIVEHLPKRSAVWVAATGERWHEKPLVKLVANDSLERFSKINELSWGYEFGDSPRLEMSVKCTDADTVAQLRTRLGAFGTGNWAVLDKPVDPAVIVSELKRLFE